MGTIPGVCWPAMLLCDTTPVVCVSVVCCWVVGQCWLQQQVVLLAACEGHHKVATAYHCAGSSSPVGVQRQAALQRMTKNTEGWGLAR